MTATTLDQHAAWTNTLRTIASVVLRNHGLADLVELRWIYGKQVAGWAYQTLAAVRVIELVHLVLWEDIEATFWHELAHHINGDCKQKEADAPPGDIHPTVLLQRMIDDDPTSAAVGFLAIVSEQEAKADATGARLKAEFEAQYGPLFALLIGQNC